MTSKKRKGVAHFIKHFPVYIGKVENQLINADNLEIRTSVDNAYEKIVQSMFDGLKQMAKMDGEGEDKGQLNYHIILIGALHLICYVWHRLRLGRKYALLRGRDRSIGSWLCVSLREES